MERIVTVLAHYPEIEKAVLYGSRAKGNYPITPGRIEGHGRRVGGVEEVAAAPSLHRPALIRAPFPIPTGLHPSAQQPCCLPSEVLLTKEGQATLSNAPQCFLQPQRDCILPVPADGCNPVGVDDILPGSPRVASRTWRSWAGGRYPVGVDQLAESRQLVTNCHLLKAGCRSVSQLVTNLKKAGASEDQIKEMTAKVFLYADQVLADLMSKHKVKIVI